MAINLTKKEEKVNWYYSKNGNQIGPFELAELLKQIDRDTMVWREGIDWTTARLVPELTSYFPAEQKFKANTTSNSDSFQMSAGNDVVSQPKKMFAASFSFDGRIRRTEYGISSIIFYVGYLFLSEITQLYPIFGLAGIGLWWFILAQGAKRCHDRNASGWYQIIPFYGLWMLFAEGDKFTNQYGDSPK